MLHYFSPRSNHYNEWHIIADERKPHSCRLRRATAQVMDANAFDQIEFDTQDFDVGEIGDIATNYRIDIKRAGKYAISISSGCENSVDSDEGFNIRIYKNGTVVTESFERSSGATDEDVEAHHTIILNLAVDDYISFFVKTFDGFTTSTTVGLQPQLFIMEIR